MDAIKVALIDLVLSIIKGIKIFFVFIIPAVIIATLTSSEFRDLLSSRADVALYSQLINVGIIIPIVEILKKRIPEGSIVNKIL